MSDMLLYRETGTSNAEIGDTTLLVCFLHFLQKKKHSILI